MRESRFHVQGGQRSNLYYLQIFEDEQSDTQLIEDQMDENNDIDVSNAEPNNLNINDPHQASINIDVLTIDFKEILEECVSRSPCHDGIP